MSTGTGTIPNRASPREVTPSRAITGLLAEAERRDWDTRTGTQTINVTNTSGTAYTDTDAAATAALLSDIATLLSETSAEVVDVSIELGP